MSQLPTTSLHQATISTFESLAMLFPDEKSVDGVEFLPLASAVSVTYRGDVDGRVVVGVTGGVLPALAENMLGAAAAPDAGLQRDALGEVANVITGNVLPLLHGATAVFRLDAPTLIDGAALVAQPGEVRTALTHVQMDEGSAVVAMFAAAAAPHLVAADSDPHRS